MKPLILLAAAGLGTLVALPHLPSVTTIKDELAALHLSPPAQEDPQAQPAQDPAAAPAADQGATPAATTPDASGLPTSEPLVSQTSPDEVRHSYGEPQSVERTVYGETWYYPVYIFYFRNGFVQRTPHASCTARTNSVSVAAPAVPIVASSAASGYGTQQPWRFSTGSSLGTVSLNGSGVRRTYTFVPAQTSGVATTGGSSSVHSYSGSTSTSANPAAHTSSSAGVGIPRSSAPTSTRTVAVPRSMPAAPSQGYSRTGAVGY